METLNFPLFAITSILFWVAASVVSTIKIKRKLLIVNILSILGLIIFSTFITLLWMKLERPPMRTLGETRIWYSVFMALIGIIAYNRWKYAWFFIYSNFFAVLFLVINILMPENFSKSLMPALQSVWFVPHVIVYIFSYALFGASSLVAAYGLWLYYNDKYKDEVLALADNLVYIGFGFLTMGLLFGALWAKEAWGHYWTWDPKETWAFLTFLAYLVYMHFRNYHSNKTKISG